MRCQSIPYEEYDQPQLVAKFQLWWPWRAGLATEQGLYGIAEVYDLASEDFHVTFLTHETRHYVDYERSTNLEGPELEYRVKLAELAIADKALSELLNFLRLTKAMTAQYQTVSRASKS